LEDLILIVDEAHNLPDRIRAHLVGDLAVVDLLKAAKEARSIDGEVAHELVGIAKSMERFLTALRSERIARKDEFLDVVEAGLRRKGGETRGYTAFVEGLAFAGEDAVRRGVPSHLPEIAEFFVRWRDQDEGILRLVVPGPDGKFAFRLLDPSVLSRSVFDGVHASILMSGTLFPAEMYADLLGIAARRRVLRTYASPFPRENRLLLVSPNVTTLFVKRGKEMHDAIAREIGGIAAAVPGNVAAFFPSYELLGERGRGGPPRLLRREVRVREGPRLCGRLSRRQPAPSGRRPGHPERAGPGRHRAARRAHPGTAIRAVPPTGFRTRSERRGGLRGLTIPPDVRLTHRRLRSEGVDERFLSPAHIARVC